jgi:hypothetical protein
MSLKHIEDFIETADYRQGTAILRDILRRHLVAALGGNWERIHNQYGMYTMNCRAKGTKRTIQKCQALAAAGEIVTASTFCRRIPDLVAGRLVVVDPADLFALAEKVREACITPAFLKPDAPLVQYRVRHGKFSMYDVNGFQQAGYNIDVEPSGYCSVHFVFRTGKEFFEKWCHSEELEPLRMLDHRGAIPLDAWHVEVQVRTLMEEAWGETDHFVRYEDPTLRDDPDIQGQFASLAAYLQAASHHVSLIREAARRKGTSKL